MMNGRSWLGGTLRKGSRCPFCLVASTQRCWPKLTLASPIFFQRAAWYFGRGLAEAWLGHQQVWIIVGSANHVGPTAFVEKELTFDGDREDDDGNIQIYILLKSSHSCSWNCTPWTHTDETPNGKFLKLCYSNLVNLTMNIDGEITSTGLSISSSLLLLFWLLIATSIHSPIFSYFS